MALAERDPELRKEYLVRVREATSLDWLARTLVGEQFNYEYDPCGKSWDELDTHLSDLGRAILKRMYYLTNGEANK